jgi:hypothetical protein
VTLAICAGRDTVSVAALALVSVMLLASAGWRVKRPGEQAVTASAAKAAQFDRQRFEP